MSKPENFDQLLQQWQPQPSTQPDFARRVHDRIQTAPPSLAGKMLRFPTALPLAASLAIVAGTVAGLSVNADRNEQQMADAYARSIDALRMVGHTHP